ncbi:hypothetical protein [Candidatus Methylobacter favarea]|uniref:hypothetical protein n=1 Tax=Candidatus Methylobacter favarea TaxID=2707345 RepID=UPI00157D97E1|nr:hypothetical protein [Candidatus Methylobacter favarea]
METKGFTEGNKPTANKREIAFKQILRHLAVFYYSFNAEFHCWKSLMLFGPSLLKCLSCMTMEGEGIKAWTIT